LGYVEPLKAVLRRWLEIQDKKLHNDQIGAHIIYGSGNFSVAIDWNQDIVQNVHLSMDHVSFENGVFVNTHTHSKPVVIHFNGGSKHRQQPMFSAFADHVSKKNLPKFLDAEKFNTGIVPGTNMTMRQICCGKYTSTKKTRRGKQNKLPDPLCNLIKG